MRQIVEVKSSDAGFYADDDCGTWSMDLSPAKQPTATFGGGFWQVPGEVAPGLWRNDPASGGCYWERLSGFSGAFGDVIANGFESGMNSVLVQVEATDAGFYADDDCGTWSYQGP